MSKPNEDAVGDASRPLLELEQLSEEALNDVHAGTGVTGRVTSIAVDPTDPSAAPRTFNVYWHVIKPV